MVSRWIKYLKTLSISEQEKLDKVIDTILSWDFDWLDIKTMKWSNSRRRCRVWKLRIIFNKSNGVYMIESIWPRWDTYK
jgi:hypothetical protein